MRGRWKHLVAASFLVVLLAGSLLAQEASEHPAAANSQSVEQAASQEAGNANEGVAEILGKTTENAAHSAEKWGDKLGLGPKVSFAISIALNFLGIAAFVWVLLKSKLPQAFRERTATIQKGIREAQSASADASRRLGDIETRLSKLDTEVAAIRQSAERESAAEDERIRLAAEQDKQRIIEGAQAEVEAMTRNAQRELKGYAAALAVDLAGRRIHVDEGTDRALIREFVDQLGKDGH